MIFLPPVSQSTQLYRHFVAQGNGSKQFFSSFFYRAGISQSLGLCSSALQQAVLVPIVPQASTSSASTARPRAPKVPSPISLSFSLYFCQTIHTPFWSMKMSILFLSYLGFFPIFKIHHCYMFVTFGVSKTMNSQCYFYQEYKLIFNALF